jgi:hypothetical protein
MNPIETREIILFDGFSSTSTFVNRDQHICACIWNCLLGMLLIFLVFRAHRAQPPAAARPKTLLFVFDKSKGEVVKPADSGSTPKEKDTINQGANQYEASTSSSKPASQHEAGAPSSTAAQPPPVEKVQGPTSSSNVVEPSKSESTPSTGAASHRSAALPAGGQSSTSSEKRRAEEPRASVHSVNGEVSAGSASKGDALTEEVGKGHVGITAEVKSESHVSAAAKTENRTQATKPDARADTNSNAEVAKPEAALAARADSATEKPAQRLSTLPVKQESLPPAVKAEPSVVTDVHETTKPVKPAVAEPPADSSGAAKDTAAAQAGAANTKDTNASRDALRAKAPSAPKESGAGADAGVASDGDVKAASASTASESASPVAMEKTAEKPGDAAGDVSTPTAASKEEVKSEEPSFRPSQPAKQKKIEPLPAGEKRVYDNKFMLEFKELCKEMPESVRNSLQHLPAPPGAGSGGGGDGTPRGVSGGRPGGTAGQPGASMMSSQMGGSNGRSTPVGGRNDPRMGTAQRDPRAGAGQGGSQRDLRAGGRGSRNMPQSMSMGPIKPLERTENAYDVSKTQPRSHYDMVMKEIRGMLNKLTLTNFDKLSDDLVKLDITDPEELRGIVSIIFDKSLEETHFCNMYARLCNKIKDTLPKFAEPDDADPPPGKEKAPKKELTFKRCLLNKCQQEFERADRYEDLRAPNETEAQHAAKSRKVRMRMLGNIKFIGELFAQNILNEKIMHECVTRLLGSNDEDTIECLCKLMATIGKLLDHEKAKHYMDYYFEQVRSLPLIMWSL